MNIEIKERPLKNGNRSLYLEYYETGFRKKEMLGIYLLADDAPNARRINREALKKAQKIKAERMLHPELLKDKDEQKEEKENEKAETLTWIAWCDEYIAYSKDCGNGEDILWHKGHVKQLIKRYLRKIKKPDILLKDVDHDIVSGLYDYMRKYRNRRQCKQNKGKLSEFTLMLFGETVNAIFNKAVRENLIAYNPVKSLTKNEKFHTPDTHREFLTADELRRFLAVETTTETERTVQKAFGFAAMTGLRYSDMRQLRWSHIKTQDGVPTLSIVQQKTKKPISVPLNALALSLLPPRPTSGEDSIIFHLVKKSDCAAMYVRRIKDKAGIEKDFTFHSSRHTAATLAITAGAELYTVSKILGHSSIASTQVYAKVNMEKKVEAVNLFDGAFE